MTRRVGVASLLAVTGCGPVVVGYADEAVQAETQAATDSGPQEPETFGSSGGGSPDGELDVLPDFVGVGQFNFIVASFDDGQTWDEFWDPDATGDDLLEGVTRGSDRVVAVGGFRTYVSTNGQTWESFEADLGYARAVTYGADIFVGVGQDLRTRSRDALGWIDEREPDTGFNFWDVTYGDGRFVAVGKDFISTSVDGQQWVTTPLADPPVVGVVFHEGRFVGVGYEGRVILTRDGVTIDQQTQVPGPNFANVCVYRGRLVAALETGALRVSDDGLEWAETAVPETHAVACGEDSLVAVGSELIYRGAEPISMELVHEVGAPLLTVAYTGAPGR